MNDVLKLRGHAIDWRELDGEVVALEAERSLYLTANPAGTLLWRRLAEGATRDELVSSLCAAYAVERELAGRDVDSFVASARTHGLLEE
jgi:coenzyme PQQ synthesis protein D (PqqD)